MSIMGRPYELRIKLSRKGQKGAIFSSRSLMYNIYIHVLIYLSIDLEALDSCRALALGSAFLAD